jgi:hypothetical protein
MEHLRMFGLCHDITLTGTKSESIFQQLFSRVVAQTNESNVHWSPRPGTASPDNASNDYVESPFIILVNGNASKDKGHHPLHPLHCSMYDITVPKLIKTMKKITHPLQSNRNLIAICMYLTLPCKTKHTYHSFKAHVGESFAFLTLKDKFCTVVPLAAL